MNSNGDPTSMLLVLLNEILSEILSRLPFKTLMQMKCVCKSLKTLISDPAFAKVRLQKSLCDASLTLIPNWSTMPDQDLNLNCSIVPFPVTGLVEDEEITIDDDPYYLISDKDCCQMVGSCNGLICYSSVAKNRNWLRFWNPATHSLSEKLFLLSHGRHTKFTFGYDISTKTYKVVAYSEYNVKILTLGDNVWRNIRSFPVVPFHVVPPNGNCHPFVNNGVYVSGTINWLAIRNTTEYQWTDILVEQFVIVSLDLATETYQQLLPPEGFVEVPTVEPSVTVLMDCLCFSHSFQGYFVLWKMMEFGVQDSWTQFLKISF
ncbi:F-box/kelch-repeat protein At3g23880 [Medicago truncatula]|uniref:F-box protein interaction domain protein n=1 Tax=Medicago truncatula TaxID=3880 RepID=A0A072U0H8_MEDTR|nr:F-box/kelch-repeat protein At3g23880 [Medicago truncatula]KEH22643.1 F-box protein interaction domain protein [Medicago truncatula]